MHVEARDEDGDLLYFTCIACGGDIYPGFSRLSGPVKHLHYHRARHKQPCRLIVVPDPVGDEHEMIEVPDEDSMDDYLQRELDDYRVAIRQSQAWSYRAGQLGAGDAA